MHRRAFLLLLGPGLTGCVGMTLRPGALDEAVRVRGLALAFTSDGAGTLSLQLDVDNPTLWAADITGVDFALVLGGRRYAVGTRGVHEPLASRAHLPLAVSFPLRCEPTPATAPPAPGQWVEVRGTVALSFGGTVRRLPFRTERFLRLAHFRPLRLTPE